MTAHARERFRWGVATSAYQIEGATGDDGRGRGIWDEFAARGAIRGGQDATVACDHYRRWPEDVALLRRLGVDAYRFSLSWPRVLPDGIGRIEPRGLAFYDRLVDGLLGAGIEPWPTLYHWDLPQALQDAGGWTARSTVEAFAEWTDVVARHLGDRVRHWIVINEAGMTSHRGHAWGTHAPGLHDAAAFHASIHHQNLAQGRGLAVLRQRLGTRAVLGTSVLLQPCRAASAVPDDVAAARRAALTWNRACLDPLLLGRYPPELEAELEPWIHDGDLDVCRAPLDFLGVNYYVPHRVRAAPDGASGFERVKPPATAAVSPFGMELHPEGLGEMLEDLRRNYGNPTVLVTECGYADVDDLPRDTLLQDVGRIEYLGAILAEVERAQARGSPVAGLFVWSLLDNFEWEFGYWPRFGLVHVDYETQARTPKQSFDWYADVIARSRAAAQRHGRPAPGGRS